MSFINELMQYMRNYRKCAKYLNIEKQMSPKEYGIMLQGKRKRKRK